MMYGSILHHFCFNILNSGVKEVALFATHAEQKLHTEKVFHWLVGHDKRFEKVAIIFPLWGHSYLERDKNMGLVNTQTEVETPVNDGMYLEQHLKNISICLA